VKVDIQAPSHKASNIMQPWQIRLPVQYSWCLWLVRCILSTMATAVLPVWWWTQNLSVPTNRI